MTLSSRLGMRTKRPVVSLQRSGSGWILSFSSGVAGVEIYTESDVETGSYEGSTISKTDYGYKATVRTVGPPRTLHQHDDIYILGVLGGQSSRTTESVISTSRIEKFIQVKNRLRRTTTAGTSESYDSNSDYWTKTEKLKR